VKVHGVREVYKPSSIEDLHWEEFNRIGYTLIRSVLSQSEVARANESIMSIYARQEREFGKDALAKMNELNVVRALCAYDDFFLEKVIMNEVLTSLTKRVLGQFYVLHSQVATINEPQIELYQTAWHRELQYQHFVSSRPLAVQTIFCLDPFNSETGATFLIPGSHLFEEFPSSEFATNHETQLVANPGDVLFMNSMIYHRAGINTSKILRRLITNTYTVPIIAQQINLSEMMDKKYASDEFLAGLLGFRWAPASSPESWRTSHSSKR
jgi:ectoine hydroxylase-related dioxygenase (phytanoyl-CoA dioxygenase family)